MSPIDPAGPISPSARAALEARTAAVRSTRADLDQCEAKYKRLLENLCDTEFYALMGLVVQEGLIRDCVGQEKNRRFIERLVGLHAEGKR
jgi:hypothetical protein